MLEKLYQYAVNLKRYLKQGGIVECEIVTSTQENRYNGKIVCITGGSSGIGLAMAKRYVKEGAKVIIIGRREQKLKNAVKEIEDRGKEVTYVIWDVCNISQVNDFMEKLFSIYGEIDIFINNAGVYNTSDFLNMTEVMYDKTLNTNLKSVYFNSQAYVNYILEHCLEGKTHRILNIVSNRELVKDSNPYGISKWGAACFTKGLAAEVRKYNILVNGISPGITASEINGIEIEKNGYYSGSLDHRIAAAEEIAELAAFLTSELANHMVGEIVVIDGGETL